MRKQFVLPLLMLLFWVLALAIWLGAMLTATECHR